MNLMQPGILEALPPQARYLGFDLAPEAHPAQALRELARVADGRELVVGIGADLARALGATIPGLRPFAAPAGARFDVPATPAALWCWLRGHDRGVLVQRTRGLAATLAPVFALETCIDAFVHADGRDLSGYEDGTENPVGDAAVAAASVDGQGAGLDGSSFVAVQQWRHALERFEAMTPQQQDAAIGRRRSDNVELDDAPPSAHVKRTAQESFDPEAFVLRRSMPWADAAGCGLVFVAFGRSFDAFEAQLARMLGVEDGITDALFRFTRPVSGAHFWCPPLRDGRLDLRALGL